MIVSYKIIYFPEKATACPGIFGPDPRTVTC
jgi:hypothetical protein